MEQWIVTTAGEIRREIIHAYALWNSVIILICYLYTFNSSDDFSTSKLTKLEKPGLQMALSSWLDSKRIRTLRLIIHERDKILSIDKKRLTGTLEEQSKLEATYKDSHSKKHL